MQDRLNVKNLTEIGKNIRPLVRVSKWSRQSPCAIDNIPRFGKTSFFLEYNKNLKPHI